MTTSRRGGRRPGAGRKPGRMPRLSKEEVKALLKTLVPNAHSSADYARALACRPERIREALRQGCTVKCADSWRAPQVGASAPVVEEDIRIARLEGARMMQAAAMARCREVSARADARGAVGGTQQEADIATGAHRCWVLVEGLDPVSVVGEVRLRNPGRYPCTACSNFLPSSGVENGWACRAIDESADWIDRATGAVNGRMADGHDVPIPQDARTCPAFNPLPS